MGEVIRFARRRRHARASLNPSSLTACSTPTCASTSMSLVSDMPLARAPVMIAGQYRTGIEPRRFISEAADGNAPASRPKDVGPPSASMSSETVMPTHVHASCTNVNMIDVYTLCEYQPMETMGDRLKKAREQANFPSARQAALKNKWGVSTYSAHENGQNEYGEDEAKKYGRVYKVDPWWLLTGEGIAKKANVAKIMGRIGAAAEITPDEEQVPPDGLGDVDVPFPIPDDMIAFEVEGTSMWPRYEAGDIVICRNSESDPAALVGFEVAVKTAEGRRYLKRLRTGSKRGRFDLESHNAGPIVDQRIIWASPVYHVVRAGQWRLIASQAGKRRAG